MIINLGEMYLSLQVGAFVAAQADHLARAEDVLQLDWMFANIKLLGTMIPPPPVSDPDAGDTLPLRVAAGRTSREDRAMMPFFRHISFMLRTVLADVIYRAVQRHAAFWRRYDLQLAEGARLAASLAGYPRGVQACRPVCVCLFSLLASICCRPLPM